MISGSLAGLIVALTILETLAQVCAREYYENNNRMFLIIIGWFLYLGALLALVEAYDYTGLAIANALWNAGTIIAMAVIGYFFYKESLSVAELSGMGLVIAGSIIMGFYSKEKSS